MVRERCRRNGRSFGGVNLSRKPTNGKKMFGVRERKGQKIKSILNGCPLGNGGRLESGGSRKKKNVGELSKSPLPWGDEIAVQPGPCMVVGKGYRVDCEGGIIKE